MSLLQDLLSRKLTALTKEQLYGATRIITQCFYEQPLLTAVELPDSIEYVGHGAFTKCDKLQKVVIGKNVSFMGVDPFSLCSALTDIDTEKMNPYCEFFGETFTGTAWYNNTPEGSLLMIAKNQILVGNKISTPGGGFEIPDTVKNLAPYSCATYGNSVDSTFTSIVVPDTVEMIQVSAFSGQTALTKITIGSLVNKITGTIIPGTNVKNFVFRQPAGMYVELPTPGSNNGMVYNKDSYSLNVYTDNEYIKNYDWATDNATVTFYPLSDAPA